MALKHFWLGMTLIAGAFLLIAALCLTGCSDGTSYSGDAIVKQCANGSAVIKDETTHKLQLRSKWSAWDGYHYIDIADGAALMDVCK